MHKFINLKKAGRVINLGKKSKVRGLAKNACDHPHVEERVENLHHRVQEVLEVDLLPAHPVLRKSIRYEKKKNLK